MRERRREELRFDLDDKQINSQGTKSQLIAKCNAAGINTEKTIPDVTSYGFVGIAKGAYQILWERGFVKPNKEDTDNYTVHGRKDENGIIIKETSINYLIWQCEDFVHEKTLLQYYGEKLGSIID